MDLDFSKLINIFKNKPAIGFGKVSFLPNAPVDPEQTPAIPFQQEQRQEVSNQPLFPEVRLTEPEQDSQQKSQITDKKIENEDEEKTLDWNEFKKNKIVFVGDVVDRFKGIIKVAIEKIPGVKWKIDKQKPNFYQFLGTDRRRKKWIMQVRGDQPIIDGQYKVLFGELIEGESESNVFYYNTIDSINSLLSYMFDGFAYDFRFEPVDLMDMAESTWRVIESKFESGGRERLNKLLRYEDNQRQIKNFIAQKIKEIKKADTDLNKTILLIYVEEEKYPNLPAKNEVAVYLVEPIIHLFMEEVNKKNAEALLSIPAPDIKVRMKQILDSTKLTVVDAKKVLLDVMVDSPELPGSLDYNVILPYLQRWAPHQIERRKLPEEFKKHKLTVPKKDVQKMMERAIAAWNDPNNSHTQKLKSLLQADAADKEIIVKWLKQVGAWHESFEPLVPNTTMEEMQVFINRLSQTIETPMRYTQRGIKPFTFDIYVKFSDDDYFFVILTAEEVDFDVPIPMSLIKKFADIHREHYNELVQFKTMIGWAKVMSKVAETRDKEVKIWIVDEVQSDIAKHSLTDTNAGRFYWGDFWAEDFEPFKEQIKKEFVSGAMDKEVRNRIFQESGIVLEKDISTAELSGYVENPSMEEAFRNAARRRIRNSIDNRMFYFHEIIFNLIVKQARESGVHQIWIPKISELLRRVSRIGDEAKSLEELFKRIYEKAAEYYGAKTIRIRFDPKIEKFKNAYIAFNLKDVPSEKIAKFAKIVVGDEIEEEEYKERKDWPDEQWKIHIITYVSAYLKAMEKLDPGGLLTSPQEAFELYWETQVPKSMKSDVGFAEKLKKLVEGKGHKVELPGALKREQELEKRKVEEEMESEKARIQMLPEMDWEDVLQAWERMEAMPEGESKEKAKARIEEMRRQLELERAGSLRLAWGGKTLDYVLDAWENRTSARRGNYRTDGREVYFHGNAVLSGNQNDFWISGAGWLGTKTTRAILRHILYRYSNNWILTTKYNKDVLIKMGLDRGAEKIMKWDGERVYFQDGNPRGLEPFTEEDKEEYLSRQREYARKERAKTEVAGMAREKTLELMQKYENKTLSKEEMNIFIDSHLDREEEAIKAKSSEEDFYEVFSPKFKESIEHSVGTLIKLKLENQLLRTEPMKERIVIEDSEEEPLVASLKMADAVDPSDWDLQKGVTEESFKNRFLDPDSILYRKHKGRGAPYGESGSGQGELKTNLPASIFPRTAVDIAMEFFKKSSKEGQR